MKRIISVLLILIALVSVCACDGGKEDGAKKGGNTYTGTINGDKAVLTIKGEEATVKITKSYRRGGLEHTYIATLTAPFTKNGDQIVLDITQEGATVLAQFTLKGDSDAKAAYLETIKGLSYNTDPLYLEYCDGTEVEITRESTVWSAAGIGVYENLTLRLGGDQTFQWISN